MFKNWLFKLVAVLILAISIVLALFWTPDTNWQSMYVKYHASQTSFAELDNGVQIHYRDSGNPLGHTIVFIHGTSDSILSWDAVSDYLQPEYRLISLDLPGHGFSSSHPNANYSREAMVESVSQLMDKLKIDSATLIGNSLGGGIAWRTALAHPEKVEHLVLLDPSGAPQASKSKSNLGFRVLRNPIGRLIALKITPRALVEQSLIDTVVDEQLVNAAMVDRYWELLRLPGNRQALAEMALEEWNQTAWENIKLVQHPTLIIWGANDQLIPLSSAYLFSQALPNNELIIYSDIGHLPMVEASARTAADIIHYINRN